MMLILCLPYFIITVQNVYLIFLIKKNVTGIILRLHTNITIAVANNKSFYEFLDLSKRLSDHLTLNDRF